MNEELDASPTPSAVSTAKTVSASEVSHVIIRACTNCQSQRTIGKPCGTCGNPTPPEVTKLGVVSAGYRNPVKNAWWRCVRAPLANRRIRRAGARTFELRANRGD